MIISDLETPEPHSPPVSNQKPNLDINFSMRDQFQMFESETEEQKGEVRKTNYSTLSRPGLVQHYQEFKEDAELTTSHVGEKLIYEEQGEN